MNGVQFVKFVKTFPLEKSPLYGILFVLPLFSCAHVCVYIYCLLYKGRTIVVDCQGLNHNTISP